MAKMTDEDKRAHLQAVLDALPAHLKKKAEIRSYLSSMKVKGVTISIESDWHSVGTKMKCEFDWVVKYAFDAARTRTWKLRSRDGKFAYDRVANYIVKFLDKYQELLDRRAKGHSIAARRAAKLEIAFERDPMLSALNLKIETGPTHHTECGEVDVDFQGKDHGGPRAALKYDGQTFRGNIEVGDLSAEQVTALMVVLRVDQLNVLDMIAFADDSILGPSIRKLTEELNNA